MIDFVVYNCNSHKNSNKNLINNFKQNQFLGNHNLKLIKDAKDVDKSEILNLPSIQDKIKFILKTHFESFKKVNLKVLNKLNHAYLNKPLSIYYNSLLHELKDTLDDPNFDEVYLKVG